MLPFYEVGGIGQVFVPSQFRDVAMDDVKIKFFGDRDLGRPRLSVSHPYAYIGENSEFTSANL